MMAKDPEQRLATAAEVQEKLLPWAAADAVLPLDRQGDREYQQAIAELESAEVPLELIAEVLPVGIPVPAKGPGDPDSSTDSALSGKSSPAAARFTRPRLLLALAVLFVTGLTLGWLLTLFVTR